MDQIHSKPTALPKKATSVSSDRALSKGSFHPNSIIAG